MRAGKLVWDRSGLSHKLRQFCPLFPHFFPSLSLLFLLQAAALLPRPTLCNGQTKLLKKVSFKTKGKLLKSLHKKLLKAYSNYCKLWIQYIWELNILPSSSRIDRLSHLHSLVGRVASVSKHYSQVFEIESSLTNITFRRYTLFQN